jgi:ribosomal protein S18 acetylase RimI-like enzyme
MTITPLTTDADLALAFPLMATLRDRIHPDTFAAEVRRQQQGGYHLLGLFNDVGTLVAIAGYRESHTLSRGPHLFIDDLVTAPNARRQGHATALLQHLARHALSRNLPTLYLDSRNTAQSYYAQLGFTFQTSIPCHIPAATLLAPGSLQ